MRWPRVLACILVASLLPGGNMVWAGSRSEQNTEKLATTQSALKQAREKADALAQKVRLSTRDMDRLRSRTTELARALQRNESALSASEQRMQRLQQDIREREQRLQLRDRQNGRTLLAMLNAERLPPAAIFARPGNATDMLRTASVLQAMREQLTQEAAQLRSELEGLEQAKQQWQRTRLKALEEGESLRARRKLLDADLAERRVADAQLRRDQTAIEREATRLSRESKSLQELINRLAAEPAQKPQGNVRKGSLSTPVAGGVRHRFGERKNAAETWRGMVLGAREGAVVVAPAAGEVAFTGPFMNYGPMVLLRHTGGYISLLAGLGQVDVRAGQAVGAGEPVGRMGGGNPELYVELREKGKPIDPAGWFANVGKSLAVR